MKTINKESVLTARLADGYALLGYSASTSVSGNVAVIVKNTHTMAINCLGYDEHTHGKTYDLRGEQ
jgi:hypothetical protein